MKHIVVVALALVLVLDSHGQVQDPQKHSGELQAAGQTTLRATTELVLVPVIVTDAAGKPVTGLKREDFAIYADGKRQTIASLDEVQVTLSAANIGRPDWFSNYVVDSKSSVRPIILVIDLLNSAASDQRQARDQVLHFLETQLRPDRPVGLFLLSGKGLQLLQSFTTSSADLKAAVLVLQQRTSYTDQNSSDQSLTAETAATLPPTAEVTRAIQSMILSMDRVEGMRQREAITTTLDAMDALAAAFSGIPGRKNLIWLTAGFPFQVTDPDALGGSRSEFAARYERTWQKLSNADVAVYPVDMRGLFDSRWASGAVISDSSSQQPAVGSDALHEHYGVRSPIVSQETSINLTLQLFAQQTSGNVCMNNNELAKCLAAAAQDGENNYTLSFYVGPDIRAKGWHKLKVSVIKPAGLKIRSREGFSVGNSASSALAAAPEKAVLAALRSPVPLTALPFSVQWVRQAEPAAVNPRARLTKDVYGPATTGAVFRISFPPHAFAIDSSDTNRVQLDIDAVAIDGTGKLTGDFAQTVTAHLKPDVLSKVESAGFSYTDAIALPTGSFQVRFVVRDAVSGEIGSVDAPIRVTPSTNVSDGERGNLQASVSPPPAGTPVATATPLVPTKQASTDNSTSHCQTIEAGDPRLSSLSALCEFALTYRRQLPDFICEQTTTSTSRGVTTVLKAQVTFEKGHERYSNITIDGKPPKTDSGSTLSAIRVITAGELGSDLVDLFEPPIVAEFKFRKQENLRDTPSLLYDFHIAAEKNTFWSLRDSRGVTVHAEYLGELWVNRQSGQLLRLELRPVRLPENFDFTAAEITTDYANTAIADAGTFLLPYQSMTTACTHIPGASGSRCTINRLTFHDCRKFGTNTRIVTDNPQP